MVSEALTATLEQGAAAIRHRLQTELVAIGSFDLHASGSIDFGQRRYDQTPESPY
jgi:hypothetical protein